MNASRDEGFTLLELLVVVTIIGIIAAFALPRLLRAREIANETSAIGSLRAVGIAEELYAKVCGQGVYAVSFLVLGTPAPGTTVPFLPADLTPSDTPQKSGYRFTLATGLGGVDGGHPDCHGVETATRYYASGVPSTVGITGRRSFAMTTPTVIWEQAGATAPTEPFGSPATPLQ